MLHYNFRLILLVKLVEWDRLVGVRLVTEN